MSKYRSIKLFNCVDVLLEFVMWNLLALSYIVKMNCGYEVWYSITTAVALQRWMKYQETTAWLCVLPVLFRNPGPVFTKRTDVLPQDLVGSWSREIGCYSDRIALKFDRHLGSAAAEVHVKFQSDYKSLTWISRLRDFTISCGERSVRLGNRSPGTFSTTLWFLRDIRALMMECKVQWTQSIHSYQKH